MIAGAEYLLVDDFIGQGGTLANLKGYIESSGGRVLGATGSQLTGKPYSAKLYPTDEQLAALRSNMETNSKFGGTSGSVTASTALLNQRLATLNVPRMLTPSEVALLRKSKQEIAARYRATHK